MKTILIFLFAACSIFASCKKDKLQEDSLPPATQTGANTFGCYINGKLYVPKGFEQNKPNFDMIVDPGYFGNLEINTFSKYGSTTNTLIINCFGVRTANNYILPTDSIYPFNKINNCYYNDPINKFRSGFLKITRYDLANQIISGEFEFKLFDPTISCDTISITKGRFDKKF